MRTIHMFPLFLAIITATGQAQDQKPTAPRPPVDDAAPPLPPDKIPVPIVGEVTEAERRAYRQGAKEADQEIKEGRATIYIYGLTSLSEYLDRETGLLYEYIAGCVVDSADEARAKGHNDRIEQHIKEHGLPPNSLKKWEREIYDLSGFYGAQAKDVRPQRLVLGGQALKSPDGHATLQVSRRKFESICGNTQEFVSLVIRIDDVEREPLLVLGELDGADIAWGPNDAPFAVLRSQSSEKPLYTAIELRAGKKIRWSR